MPLTRVHRHTCSQEQPDHVKKRASQVQEHTTDKGQTGQDDDSNNDMSHGCHQGNKAMHQPS